MRVSDINPQENKAKKSENRLVAFVKQIKNGLSTPKPDDFDSKAASKQVISIAWPAMVESFLLHLASMVDTMMVGSLGTWAIASVGYCTQPRMLLLAVFQAFNTGCTALIARAKGAGNHEEANKVLHMSLLISLIFGVLMAFIGYTFARQLVLMMGAMEDVTISNGTAYMQVLMISFPANVMSLSITAALRGIGKTKISMVYNVIANSLNIVGNYLFINGNLGCPALGVRGAALGMVIGWLAAFVIAIVVILRGVDMLKLNVKKLFKVDFSILRRVVNIGLPAMFEQFFMRIGQILFGRVVASLGTQQFATHQIANNIWSMTMMNGMAFGISATSLTGQSLGRKRPDQGKAYVQLCRRYSMIISLCMAAGLIFLGKPLAGMYTTEAAVIAQSAMVLRIVALIQPLQSSQQVLAGALRGAGDTKAVAMCIFLGIVVVRPIFSAVMVFGLGWGLIGVWLALICDQSMRSLYTMWRFSTDKWKTLKV